MYSFKLSFLATMYSLLVGIQGMITVRQFVYQRDMSEHCRRRVMPSVFIGRNIVQASAQILHFSQLEVPYSCFISVRTESGGNIILAMKVEDDEPALRDCRRKGESPVKVYEMGETFGGYWGQLPDSILEGTPATSERYYTLKPEPKSESKETLNLSTDEEEYSTEREPILTSEEPPDTQEYVTFEVPLVNVSGRLVTSDEVYVEKEGGDPDLEAFDKFYKVKMKPGYATSTTIFPLVQFSVGKDQSVSRRFEASELLMDGGREGVDNATDNSTTEMRYQLDYETFTIDPRLSFLFSDQKGIWPAKKYPALTNRRFNFKKPKVKNENLFEPEKSKQNLGNASKTKNDTWSFIEALLTNLTMNKSEQLKQDTSERQRFSALLQRISDWQHNYSAYLAPNLTLSDPLSFERTTKISDDGLDAEYMESIEDGNDEEDPEKTKRTTTRSRNRDLSTFEYYDAGFKVTTVEPFEYSVTQTIIDVTTDFSNKFTSAITNTIQSITDFTTSLTTMIQRNASKLVENSEPSIKIEMITKNPITTIKTTEKTFHKRHNSSTPNLTTIASDKSQTPNVNLTSNPSWENVVQVAPKMADILNDTLVKPKPKVPTHKHKTGKRKKRSIIAIEVENAKPHNLTTASDLAPTAEAMYNFVDMQDFAQLVELQDDEIQGHVALRYMRRYVGAMVFDLCNERESKNVSNLVYLFNTSRIVLAINNFTLRRLTIVATPARLISIPGQKCPDTDLECQVAGSRVCVSQLVACDDVPNCGAADIYDEDRLMCGVGKKIQHDVYLAAFTFLTVLLTILYTVHYWLKRCVPKVSEAFFIYTNGTENLLYLDSIMRSPTDTDGMNDLSKMALPNPELDLAVLGMIEKPRKRNIFRRIFSCCCKKKKKSFNGFELVDLDLDFQGRGNLFSFPEIEINNLQRVAPLLIDSSAQTGESLQFQLSQNDTLIFKNVRKRQESVDPRVGLRDIRIVPHTSIIQTSQDSELHMLKFFRQAKLSAEKWKESPRGRALVELGSSSFTPRDGVETELKSTVYGSPEMSLETRVSPNSVNTPPIFFQSVERSYDGGAPVHNVPSVPSPVRLGSTSKKLRFDETLMTIPHKDKSNRVDDIEEESGPMEPLPSGSGRDFRRFWQSKPKDKGKKSKKKTQLTLH